MGLTDFPSWQGTTRWVSPLLHATGLQAQVFSPFTSRASKHSCQVCRYCTSSQGKDRKARLLVLERSVVLSTCKALYCCGLVTQLVWANSSSPRKKKRWLPDKPCVLSSLLLWVLGLVSGQETQESAPYCPCFAVDAASHCWLPPLHCSLWLLQHAWCWCGCFQPPNSIFLTLFLTACSLPLLLPAQETREHLLLAPLHVILPWEG